MKKKIHINQHIIRSNKKNGTTLPVITVKTSIKSLAPRHSKLGDKKLDVRLYTGNQVLELAACGLKLDACCLGLEACRLHLEQLGA
jgi:hypothetical protein